MNSFITFINQYVAISSKAEAHILSLLKEETYAKGDVLLKQEKTCKRIYFLANGVMRTYFFQKGKDVTYWIYIEPTIVTSWHSFLLQKPSLEYLEAIEDSEVYSLNYEEWNLLLDSYPELERFSRLLLEETVALIDDFYKGYYFMSAKEKYQLLLTAYPNITQRANLGYIASMLGISQETLSRIR